MEKLIESFEDFNGLENSLDIYESLIELLASNISLNENNESIVSTITKLIEKRNSILEKKVQYKRKYTENHPAKIVYSGARVRRAIFDAMKDDRITEDELNKILSEVGANYKWKKHNEHLFSLLEDGDIKYYTLSNIGKKIKLKLPEII